MPEPVQRFPVQHGMQDVPHTFHCLTQQITDARSAGICCQKTPGMSSFQRQPGGSFYSAPQGSFPAADYIRDIFDAKRLRSRELYTISCIVARSANHQLPVHLFIIQTVLL